MANTKQPTGLTIARNGLKFTASWKIADEDYDGGQQFQWRTNNTKTSAGKGTWEPTVNIGVRVTSRTVSLSASQFYPTTKKGLNTVSIRVRGKRKAVTKNGKTTTYGWSAWTSRSFTINFPNVPNLTPALDDELDNVTKFTWNASVSDTDSRQFVNTERQTMLVKACKETDGSKLRWSSSALGWGTATGSRNSSQTITEESELLASGSYTRWMRVRSRGVRGNSAWRYAKHVYAQPIRPIVKDATSSISSGVTTCKVSWIASQTAANPIDKTTVQYCIATPGSGMTVPYDASWTEAVALRDTGGSDAAQFTISQIPSIDEALFVQVVTHHDRRSNASLGKLVRVGTLATPEITNVVTEDSTFRATITATNNSDVPDARLAVVYRASGDSANDVIVGYIPAGASSVTCQCPDWSEETAVAFGVYAFQGAITASTRADGVTAYAVTANMKSSTVWRGGSVPIAPTNVQAVQTETEGEVKLTWDWTWSKANRAEISWSTNPNAWESTDEPQTYMLDNLHAASWRVSGLKTGTIWYFRVRLAQETDGDINYGPYADAVEVDLSSAPSVPILTLSAPVVTQEDVFTASWVYTTTDGTAQAYAEVCEATIDGDTVTYGSVIASATTAQHVAVSAEEWETGSTHYLCVRVSSESRKQSEWSAPVPIIVADPIECTITATSLVEETITSDDQEERTVTSLKAMPMTATITGAGEGGQTTLIIERAADYHMIRPDGTEYDGYEGETIVLVRQDGETQITVDSADLIGLLDDGAQYRLIATTEDGYGQTASAEIPFEVHWTHQAEIPTATVVIEDQIAKITPAAPEGFVAGDTCDIYRLSVDPPEIIVQGGAFGTTYVDPYPAIGESGGHRIVHRTLNGDYITADNQPAWVDMGADDGDLLDIDYAIIDFNGEQIAIEHNMALDNNWAKDFKQTNYLGGSVQGDWNPAVNRTGSVTASVVTDDLELMQTLRRLAVYTGICHVRTQDGSSYAADIQVSDGVSYDSAGKILEYTLNITRVDPEGFDGMTLEQWEAEAEEQ